MSCIVLVLWFCLQCELFLLNPSGSIKLFKCVLHSNLCSGQGHASDMIWEELYRKLQRPTVGICLDWVVQIGLAWEIYSTG